MKRIPNVMKGKYFWLIAELVIVLSAVSLYYVRAAINMKPSYVENKEVVNGQGYSTAGPRNAVDISFLYTSG